MQKCHQLSSSFLRQPQEKYIFIVDLINFLIEEIKIKKNALANREQNCWRNKLFNDKSLMVI